MVRLLVLLLVLWLDGVVTGGVAMEVGSEFSARATKAGARKTETKVGNTK